MRSGPHPLAIHLGIASSQVQKDCVSYPAADVIAQKLTQDDLTAMIKGIQLYQGHAYKREETQYNVAWKKDCVRILMKEQYLQKDLPVLFIVPSLINGFEIFDIVKNYSFMDWAAAQNVQVCVLDWGDVATSDIREISIQVLLKDYLIEALRHLSENVEGKVHVLGYCMGGTLSALAAISNSKNLATLTMLAAPWDFKAAEFNLGKHIRISRMQQDMQLLDWESRGSYLRLQILFASLDPLATAQKFKRFSQMKQDSEKAKLFVSVEDWLNSGRDLPPNIARYCMLSWFHDNATMQEYDADLSSLDLPALVIASSKDKIVSIDSAKAIHEKIPRSKLLLSDLGHIGLMVGQRASKEVWSPIVQFIKKHHAAQ